MAINFNSLDLSGVVVDKGVEPALVDETEGQRFVEAVASKKKISAENAFVAIAIIFQKGGTAKKAQGSIYANVSGVKVELSDLLQVKNDVQVYYASVC